MLYDTYFATSKLDPRKEFLRKGSPRVLGNGWVEFVMCKYSLEKRTRVLIHCNDIVSVDEGYDIKRCDEREWCVVHLKNGNHYYVKATYDEMKKLLTRRKGKTK